MDAQSPPQAPRALAAGRYKPWPCLAQASAHVWKKEKSRLPARKKPAMKKQALPYYKRQGMLFPRLVEHT